MTKVKELFHNQIIIAIIMAIFSYVTIVKTGAIPAYNFYSWLIFIILILLFFKFSFKKDKNIQKGVIIISIFLSFLLVLGRIIYILELNQTSSFLRKLFKISSLVYLIGNFNLIYTLLINLVSNLVNLNLNKVINKEGNKNKNWLVFLLVFFFLLIVYGFYFLTYYPGLLSSDSLVGLYVALEGLGYLSDHHPVAHTLFMMGPFKLGMWLFNNVNVGVAFISITQIIIMSLIFTYFIVFLYKRNVKNYLLILITLFFALLPMHGFYSITMWKDVLFAGSLLLLTIETIKLLERDKITLKNSISFILISLFNIFFRNNAIYAYLILIIFTFIIFRKSYKKLILIFIIILGIYGIVKYPLFNYLGIRRSSSTEYIAMPLQQIGRMAYKNVEFTKEEEKLLNDLIPLEVMKKSYNPISVDAIKFNSEYKAYVFDENKKDYFKLWLSLVIKHPVIAVESYLTSTLGYWYPDNLMWAVYLDVEENYFGIEMDSKIPWAQKYLNEIESRSFPIIAMSWSIGLCFWILLVASYITFKRIGLKYLYPFVPVLGIWITMMLASPVNGEFRYVYGAFCLLPLLIVYPYIVKVPKDDIRKERKKKNEKN